MTRNGLIILISLLTANCSGEATHQEKAGARASHFEARFGESQYLLPPGDPPEKADDYIPNGKAIIPPEVERCGGRSPRYNQHTDGAASIRFQSDRSLVEMQDCLHRKFANLIVEQVDGAEPTGG